MLYFTILSHFVICLNNQQKTGYGDFTTIFEKITPNVNHYLTFIFILKRNLKKIPHYCLALSEYI